MRFGKTAVAAALAAMAVTAGGCDGPFMMSDEKTDTSKSVEAGAANDAGATKGGKGHRGASADRDGFGDRME